MSTHFKKIAVAVALALAALCIVGAPAQATTEPPAEPTLASSPEPSEPEGPTDIGTPLTPEDDAPTPEKRYAPQARELAETGISKDGVPVALALGIVAVALGVGFTALARARMRA